MSSIENLPTEILDQIFGYLPAEEQRNARLVCQRWETILGTRRYSKATMLQVSPLKTSSSQRKEDLLQIARQRKVFNMLVTDSFEDPTEEYIQYLKVLMETVRSTLEHIHFECCTQETVKTVLGSLAHGDRLQGISVDTCEDLHRDVKIIPEVGLASVQFLEINLMRRSSVGMVMDLAPRLTTLKLKIYSKHYFFICLRQSNLSALRSLTVQEVGLNLIDVGADEFDGRPMEILEQLETLECIGFCKMIPLLVALFQSRRNLKRLSITKCRPSTQRHLHLARFLPTGQFPELQHLTLPSYYDFTFAPLEKLESLVIEGRRSSPSANNVLAKITNIGCLTQQKLQTLGLRRVTVDSETAEMLASLSFGTLSFYKCCVDGTVLEWLAKEETRTRVGKIIIEYCEFTFLNSYDYTVESVEDLRAKCPYLNIAYVEPF